MKHITLKKDISQIKTQTSTSKYVYSYSNGESYETFFEISLSNLYYTNKMYNTLKTYQELYFWQDQEKRMFCFSFMHIIHQDNVLTYQGYSG